MNRTRLKDYVLEALEALQIRVADFPEPQTLSSDLTHTQQVSMTYFEHCRDALLSFDASLHVQQANASATILLQQSSSALHGQPLTQLFEEDQALANMIAHVQNMPSAQRHTLYTLMLLPKDGPPIRVEACLTPMPQQIFVISLRDISQREADYALDLSVMRERESTHILQGFIEAASHEFKTPLSIINTKLYMLRRRGINEDDIAAIARQVTQLTNLVDSLTMILRLDADLVLDLSNVAVEALIRSLLDELAVRFERGNYEVITDLAPNLPLITGSEETLMIAFMHLLDNALRYTPPGGTIRIEAAALNHGLRVSVEDTGIGIEPEHMPHIFKRFYRIDQSQMNSGMGLGLPIVERIIELHDGRISVESQPAQGSRFTLWLPVQNQLFPP